MRRTAALWGAAGALALGAVLPPDSAAQSVQVARWRYNRTAAYSIVLDDYCTQYFGDVNIVDSTTENRGMRVAFSVITNWEGCDANCRQQAWDRARLLYAKGHEFLNHSATHNPSWTAADAALEVDSSKAVIERELPGFKSLFFCYPWDSYDADRIAVFRTREFIGTRAGGGGVNSIKTIFDRYDFDPFTTKFGTYASSGGGGVTELNSRVDGAIVNQGWALLEIHNVGGGNLPTTTAEWTAHLDYCRQLMDQGRLWVAPVQQVIRYVKERVNYQVRVTSQTATTLTIGFRTDSLEINPSPAVANTLYDYPLTLLVAPPPGFSASSVVQNGQSLSFSRRGDTLQFDAAPYAGQVTITGAVPVVPGKGLVRPATDWVRLERGARPVLVLGQAGEYSITAVTLDGARVRQFTARGRGRLDLDLGRAQGAVLVRVTGPDTRETRHTLIAPSR